MDGTEWLKSRGRIDALDKLGNEVEHSFTDPELFYKPWTQYAKVDLESFLLILPIILLACNTENKNLDFKLFSSRLSVFYPRQSHRGRIGRFSDRRIFLVQYENEAFHLFVVVLHP